MDILLTIVTSVVTGLAVTLISRREGVGSWMGDAASALFGGGIGAYMVHAVSMSKVLEGYLVWIAVFSCAGALTALAFSNLLLGGEVEGTESAPAETIAVGYDYEDLEDEHPLPRAA